jgi:16S rRNA (adenine1518-N6/adenine1519-N6)-dimethyltransferase
MDLLVANAELSPNDVVLEVGTGTGALTAMIAEQVSHVISVDIDSRMHQIASEELIDFENITLLNCDALENKNQLSPRVMGEVAKHLDGHPERRFKLVANLPYGASTPVISNLLLQAPYPVSMTVTIQKELADRIVAPVGKKDYSALSLWIQCQCSTEIVRVLPPTVFWPRPQVDSAILKIVFEPERRAKVGDIGFFHDFVRNLFLYRRKAVRSGLVNVLKEKLGKPAIDDLLSQLNFDPHLRAEELTVQQHIQLASTVQNIV